MLIIAWTIGVIVVGNIIIRVGGYLYTEWTLGTYDG